MRDLIIRCLLQWRWLNLIAGTNLVLQFTVTESHIPENWGGLTEVNHVNRLMVPGANGTPLDFSSQTYAVRITKFFIKCRMGL